MIYQRYVIADSTDSTLHGTFHRVERLWDHGDGTAMFRVECDDPGFDRLNADLNITLLPSLNAPVVRLGPKAQAFIAKQGITVAPGDHPQRPSSHTGLQRPHSKYRLLPMTPESLDHK